MITNVIFLYLLLSKHLRMNTFTLQIKSKTMYNNPENIGLNEILEKLRNLHYGPNRNKRVRVLLDYSTDLISKSDWIKRWC